MSFTTTTGSSVVSAGSEPPYVKLPDPQRLFERRARRFAKVAQHSEIADYLTFLATVAQAQARTAAATLPPALPQSIAQAITHGMPPLPQSLSEDAGAAALLGTFIKELKAADLAEGPAAIVRALAGLDETERQRLLRDIGQGVFEIERLGEGALVAAALQVWYALHAAQLDAGQLRNLGERICPCCGGAPLSSMVVNWPEAPGARYLACSLCCTMWNHVRVKCTACGATKGVSYRAVEGSAGDIAAEVCESCQGYAKHLVQTKNASLDPFVDDIASYGLDMMLREEGWRRTGLNPFLISV